MVQITRILCRVPVIKFRKGGGGHSGGAPAAAPAAATPAVAPTPSQAQPVASMSTGAIPDIDLPLRYRRQPLTDEEIDHINGGGIESSKSGVKIKTDKKPQAMGVISIPRSMLAESTKRSKQVVTLNIVLQNDKN